MKKLSTLLLTAFCALLGAAELLHQDFEDTNLFKIKDQIKQVGLSKNIGGNWLGFMEDFAIAEGSVPGDQGKQVLKISRVKPGYYLAGFRTAELPADREYTLQLDLKPGDAGKCNFGFKLSNSFTNTDAVYLQFTGSTVQSIYENRGHFLFKTVPNVWQKLELTITPGSDRLQTRLIMADGTVVNGNDVPLLKSCPVNTIKFFHMPGMTVPAYIDNIILSTSDHSSVNGRENVASGAVLTVKDRSGERKLPRLNNGLTDGLSMELVHDFPAVITLDMEEAKTISSVRLHSGLADQLQYASGDMSVTKYKVEVHSTAAGQWREVALMDNQITAKVYDEDDNLRFSQADFPAIEANAVRITLLNSNDTGKRKLGPVPFRSTVMREIEVFAHARGQGTAGLGKALEAEYRLPVYREQKTAQLYAVLDKMIPSLDVELSFRDRNNGTIPAQPVKVTLKPGENIIPIDITDWANGEYRTLIKALPNQPAKGEFARLLRLDRLPDDPLFLSSDWTGKQMLFPDKRLFADSQSVDIKIFQPQIHTLEHNFHSGPDWLIQLGGAMTILPDDRLVIEVTEMTRDWKQSKKFYAIAKVGEWKWEFTETAPAGFKNEYSEMSRSICANANNNLPGTSAQNYDFIRLYDPEKDGPVDVKQLKIIYTGYQPCNWGGKIVPPQTSWAVWAKSDKEYLLLGDKPFLEDGVSSDEFESPNSTNDNFAGQYLSDDGKTFFYIRGRTLKRYAPFVARYDNLWMISRILTVFATTDGIRWEKHYYALPDENDAPTMQHYGSSLYRIPRGNGLMIGIQMDYSALHQQYDLEMVYSRGGKKWERIDGHSRWIPAAPPRGWNFGNTNMHNNIVERDGIIYHQIGWAASLPHYAHEISYLPNAREIGTGDAVKKKFDRRGMTNWPYWKDFGSYDKLAESLREDGSTCGVAVYRKNGWFGVSSDKGSFTTLPLTAQGKLKANYQTTSSGSVKFTLLDKDGKTLAEKTISGDAVAEVVFESLPKTEFQIKAELDHATIWALDFL